MGVFLVEDRFRPLSLTKADSLSGTWPRKKANKKKRRPCMLKWSVQFKIQFFYFIMRSVSFFVFPILKISASLVFLLASVFTSILS